LPPIVSKQNQYFLARNRNANDTIIGTVPTLPAIDSLTCFAEAARLLNFRAAARAVALTPAALGQRIRQLEQQVGRQLFQRTTRRVTLTEAGLALLAPARAALDAAAACGPAARGELGAAPLDLVLGTRHELGMSWIVPMLPRLAREQPRITFHLYFGSSADLLARVRTAEIDAAVGSMRITDSHLDYTRLHREAYAFVAARRLVRDRPLRGPEDAAAHTLIDSQASLSLFGYFRDAPAASPRWTGVRFGRVLRIGTIAAIRHLVLRAEGVAVLPVYLIAGDLAAGRLVRVQPRVRLLDDHFRLVFRGDDPRRAVYEAVAAVMRDVPLA
jgi:LysR family transcriptional regulator, glycine cleavage system transcriptional activator